MKGVNIMKLRILCLLLVSALIFGVACSAGPSSELTNSEKVSFDKGYRYEENGWVFVHIEGAPYERGLQHGYLLAEEIQEALRVNSYTAKWDTGEDFEFFVEAADRMFTPKLDEEFLTEIKGIAAGATEAGVEVTYQELIAWNGLMELLD